MPTLRMFVPLVYGRHVGCNSAANCTGCLNSEGIAQCQIIAAHGGQVGMALHYQPVAAQRQRPAGSPHLSLTGCGKQGTLEISFTIHGWVVLPDHMHCLIGLPDSDTDFSLRWRLIKSGFSKSIPLTEYRSPVRTERGERGVWQRCYWEHMIRHEADYAAHMDYIHINPLKHGLVALVSDWPYSTFHRYAEQGVYPKDWAGSSLADGLGYGD